MPKIIKRLTVSSLISLVLFLGTFVLFTPKVHAQAGGPWYNQNYDQWFDKVYDTTNPTEIFGERYTAAQVQWIIYSLASLPFTNTTEVLQCSFEHDAGKCATAIDDIASNIQLDKMLATNKTTKDMWVNVFSEKPLSGITYTKDQLRKFSIIPSAYAQEGFGYGALSSVQNLWRMFRNASYLFFIIITIAFSFMIMFRVKISPQTVITIQSALPKVILGIILVTFSYAIAGFMVDIMYVFIAIISSIINWIQPFNWPWLNTNVVYEFLTGTGQAGLLGFLGIYYVLFFLALVISLIYNVVSTVTGFMLVPFAAPTVLIVAVIIAVLFIFVMLWKFVKIIWMLIKTVANIFLFTIFAPIQITFGMLAPSAGFGAWLKSIAGNLAVFPVVGLMILLSFYFLIYAVMHSFMGIIANNALVQYIDFAAKLFGGEFVPENLSQQFWDVPLLGSGIIGVVFLGISYSILSLAPKAGDLIRSLIEGKPFAFGTAIGESLQPIGTAHTGIRGLVSAGMTKAEDYGRRKRPLGNLLRTIGYIK